MGQVTYEPCPRCVAEGRDRAGDNMVRFPDGGGHCFSCGKHEWPPHQLKFLIEKPNVDENKAVLPSDFTREIPAAGWKWLLQYGLSYSYWKPFVGYSESYGRLIFLFGNPTRFSIGRFIEGSGRSLDGERKWRVWGDCHRYVEVLGKTETSAGPVLGTVLVEDLISAHKVAQVVPTMCLFGTNLHDIAMKELLRLNGPVTLWLDKDQYSLLAPKINRLQSFIGASVRYVYTERDPKTYSTEEIKDILCD